MTSKIDLASLETKVDVDKIKTVPADLNKLSYVVDRDVAKTTVYDKLVTKVNTVDSKIPRNSVLFT